MSELTAEAKKARAEYLKNWKAKNPEKQAEYNRRYWEKKAEQAKSETNN